MHLDNAEIRVLALGGEQPWWHAHGLLVERRRAGGDSAVHDAVVVTVEHPSDLDRPDLRSELQQLAMEAAVVVVAPALADSVGLALIQDGVQDVLVSPETDQVVRAIRFAVARRRQQHAARLAYATDLATGLPHQDQMLEYMSQLMALRSRQPAALVVIVLRVERSVRWAGALGPEGVQVLRRKLAVRLRAALRASDVVASIGPDMFGVLLGHVESASDGHTVVGKLVATVQQPVSVAGQSFEMAVAAGLAQWPEHGRDPQVLLQRAKAQATSTAAMGPNDGYAAAFQGLAGVAANDDASGA